MKNKQQDKFEFEHDKQLSKKEKTNYIKIFDGLCKLIREECSDNGNNREQRINALEDNLYNIIKKYPELLNMKKYVFCKYPYQKNRDFYYYGRTFLYYLNFHELYNIIDKLCDDIEICKQPTIEYKSLFFDLIPTIPMNYMLDPQHWLEEYNKKSKLIISILKKHPELLSFKNKINGNNFASQILSNFGENDKYLKPFMPYILESLNNSEIATQTNKSGYNLGMLCALYKQQELFEMAYKNPKARLQKNNVGNTMEMIAKNKGLIIPLLPNKEVYDFHNQIIRGKIENICK